MSAKERQRLLDLAQELDELDRDLPSAEATFLDKVLKALKSEQALMPKEVRQLELMHKRYVDEPEEEKSKEDDEDAPPFARGNGGSAGDADVDPDDFM